MRIFIVGRQYGDNVQLEEPRLIPIMDVPIEPERVVAPLEFSYENLEGNDENNNGNDDDDSDDELTIATNSNFIEPLSRSNNVLEREDSVSEQEVLECFVDRDGILRLDCDGTIFHIDNQGVWAIDNVENGE